MKILITNCSKKIYWYADKTGETFNLLTEGIDFDGWLPTEDKKDYIVSNEKGEMCTIDGNDGIVVPDDFEEKEHLEIYEMIKNRSNNRLQELVPLSEVKKRLKDIKTT